MMMIQHPRSHPPRLSLHPARREDENLVSVQRRQSEVAQRSTKDRVVDDVVVIHPQKHRVDESAYIFFDRFFL